MVIFRQFLPQIWKFVAHNVDNFAVIEEPSHNQEALAAGGFNLRSGKMGASHVADIDPEGGAGGEEFLIIELATGYVANALVGCIELLVKISELRVYRPEDEGWVDL